MKQKNAFNSILLALKYARIGNCMTICQSVVLMLLTASFLTACTPTTNNNNYGAGKAGMSGGGATKDPGGGTGTADGGGGSGQGVRCGETKNPDLKNKLFVRDIYESIFIQKRKMKSVTNDTAGTSTVSPEAIRVLTDSLKAHYGPASHNLEFTTDKFWTEFAEKISFLDEERRLVPRNDANSPIDVPNECQIVQLAFWDESPGSSEAGTLFVNKQLWSELTQFNKIGLMAHEYFYKQARKALYKNSDTVRVNVGELLSIEGISPLFKNWVPAVDSVLSKALPKSKNGFKFCTGTSEDDPTAKMHFYQYEGSDKKQHFAIPLLSSNSINSSFLKNTDFSFDPGMNPDLAKATDLLIYQTYLRFDNLELGDEEADDLVNRRPNWFPRWFEDRGFLTAGLNKGKKHSLDATMTELSKKNEILWSDSLNSSLRSIKVSLINPASGHAYLKDQKPKSREEVVAAVLHKISSHLSICRIQWPESDGWITFLQKEISDSIKTGTRPEKFTNWISKLKTLDCSNSDKDEGNLYTEDLPNLLYSLAIGNYNTGMAYADLEKIGITSPEVKSLSAGKIRVAQDSASLTFDLRCEDYAETYFNITQKGAEEIPLHTDKKVTITPDERVNELAYSGSLENINRLGRYFKFEGARKNDERITDLAYLGSGNCNSIHVAHLNVTCDHLSAFLYQLGHAKELDLSYCRLEHANRRSDVGSDEFPQTCAIVKMKHTNDYFKIYFMFPSGDKSDSATPTIGFVRLLGQEKESELEDDAGD